MLHDFFPLGFGENQHFQIFFINPARLSSMGKIGPPGGVRSKGSEKTLFLKVCWYTKQVTLRGVGGRGCQTIWSAAPWENLIFHLDAWRCVSTFLGPPMGVGRQSPQPMNPTYEFNFIEKFSLII